MPKFRKKPVVIEAVQFTDTEQSVMAVLDFMGRNPGLRANTQDVERFTDYCDATYKVGIKIKTLEGEMTASLGDWVIKGVSGEFYPCKPDIFAKTYDEVEE